MKRIFLIGSAVILLSGCGWITTYEIMGNSRSVTYGGIVLGEDLTEAYRLADIHCAKYNRIAEMSASDSEDNTATFRCVK